MKNLVLISVFVILGSALFSQESKVVREEFYANGNLKAKFVSLTKNLIEATYFFESGAIYETGLYSEDKKTGKWTTYTVNSELQAVGFFIRDKKTGTWITYSNGEVVNRISYTTNQMAKK